MKTETTIKLNLAELDPEQLAMLYLALRKTGNNESRRAIYDQGLLLRGKDFEQLCDKIADSRGALLADAAKKG